MKGMLLRLRRGLISKKSAYVDPLSSYQQCSVKAYEKSIEIGIEIKFYLEIVQISISGFKMALNCLQVSTLN